MKLFSLFVLLSFTTLLSAQGKDIELLKEENGNIITYFAKSMTRETVLLELNITGSGFTTSASMPVKLELKGFEKKEAVVITMGESASYNVSYKVMKGGKPGVSTAKSDVPRPELDKGIVVFSKDGCGKCTYAKNTLKDKGKTFTELNISSNDADAAYMWEKLQAAGFSGGSVQTPVIMIDGKVHFNMDLKLFLADIK
jgi:glutaredoxin